VLLYSYPLTVDNSNLLKILIHLTQAFNRLYSSLILIWT